MKYKYIFLLILISSFHCFAQENSSETESNAKKSIGNRKHEIKLGAIKALILPSIDIEYERILNKYSTFGGNFNVTLTTNYPYDVALNPYFRMYFTENTEYEAKGFFAQTFLSYYTGEIELYNTYDTTNNTYNTTKYVAFGIGLGIGKKWINKKGFIIQTSVGVSRKLIGSNPSLDLIGQGDLYIGYRF